MHLTGLGLKNVRVFKDQQHFSFAPITILTGPNNSGKSVIAKTLLLLKDTFSVFPTEEKFGVDHRLEELKYDYFSNHNFPQKLIFNGSNSDSLGSFNSLISRNAKEKRVSLQLPFVFPELKGNNRGYIELIYKGIKLDNELDSVKIYLDETLIYQTNLNYFRNQEIKQETKINLGFLQDLIKSETIRTNKEELEYEVTTLYEYAQFNGIADDQSFTSSLNDFNKYSYPFISHEKEIPDNYFNCFLFNDQIENELINNYLENELNDLEQKFISKNISLDNFISFETKSHNKHHPGFESIIGQFTHAFYNYLLDDFISRGDLNHIFVGKGDYSSDYPKEVDEYMDNAPGNFQLVNFVSSSRTEFMLGFLDRSISFNLYSFCNIFDNTSLWTPVNIGFDSLINKKDDKLFYLLSQFFKIQEFAKKDHSSGANYKVYNFINDCLKKLHIGNKIIIKNIQNYGFEVKIDTEGGLIPLKDQGYGIRKLLSLILHISVQAHNSMFKSDSIFLSNRDKFEFTPNLLILEEPESNLHPMLQSYLADIIYLAALNFNMQFIVETHSEYLIRRFQFLVADKRNDLQCSDIAVIYLNEPNMKSNETEQVYDLEMRHDGMFKKDFGPGFFDEATRLTIDLLRQQ